MTEMPFAVAPVMGLLAATPVAGFALQNATPTILSWNVPNDGQLHRVLLFFTLDVTSLETGGIIRASVVLPNGAGPDTPQLIAGGLAAGTHGFAPWMEFAQAGSTVQINQASALTAGAAVLWAEIWGS